MFNPFYSPGGRTFAGVLFTASGTWTKPANLLGLYVRVRGSGGGGCAGAGPIAGGGGSQGGLAEGWIPQASLGATETVTVGAVAAAGVAGSPSSFGAHATGLGGNTSVTVRGGAPVQGTVTMAGGLVTPGCPGHNGSDFTGGFTPVGGAGGGPGGGLGAIGPATPSVAAVGTDGAGGGGSENVGVQAGSASAGGHVEVWEVRW